MLIKKHHHKERIILDLEEDELFLIAYLMEKCSNEMKDKKEVKTPLSTTLSDKFQIFINEEWGKKKYQ